MFGVSGHKISGELAQPSESLGRVSDDDMDIWILGLGKRKRRLVLAAQA